MSGVSDGSLALFGWCARSVLRWNADEDGTPCLKRVRGSFRGLCSGYISVIPGSFAAMIFFNASGDAFTTHLYLIGLFVDGESVLVRLNADGGLLLRLLVSVAIISPSI